MDGKQSQYDFLNLSKSYSIKNNITREEEIEFSDKIYKVNKYGFKQERNIIITDKAIYNLKNNTLKRRIDFKTILGITINKQTDEFVIHCSDLDYDYHYISHRIKTIIEIVAKHYEIINEQELKLFEMNIKNLNTFVTTKKEKQKQKNFTHMPNKDCISVKDYLFGAQATKTDLKKIPTKKGRFQKSTFKYQKVEESDFEVQKVIGRGAVGKITLVKCNKDNKMYAMKSMRKDQIISEGLADNILLERNILMEGTCQFLLTLSYFYQTSERIYFITPFMEGGDLYHKLKEKGTFPENIVKFIAAQVAMALQHLHELGIAYRDLKPENILIDEEGYIKLCDFGASVQIRGTEKETAFAGSPEYASPEMITYEGHTFMTDWWSFGILLYELLYGNTPFFNKDKNRMYDLISNGSISYPKCIEVENEEKPRTCKVSEEAKNLISKLLIKDSGARLGRKGLDEIKKHPFFSGISFEDLKKKKLKSHLKPTLDKENPTNNFDEEYLTMEISNSPVADWSKEEQYSDWFNQFNEFDGDDGFEIIDSSDLVTEQHQQQQDETQGGGDDEEEPI